MTDSRKAIIAALLGNAAIAVTKFVAAFVTGSSSMASEGVHSLVDTVNEVLLLHGQKRSKRRADKVHPYGYGRELYFWTFVVAIMVFALGSLVSIYQGVMHVLTPAHVENAIVAYAVLGLSLLFEGISWRVGFKEFHRSLRPGETVMQGIKASKDLSLIAVLLEDTAALIGLIIALLGLMASHLLKMPQLDGVASVLIGVVLAIVAFGLGNRARNLLLGESADPELINDILTTAAADPAVVQANGVLTSYHSPDQFTVALSAEFKDDLKTPQIEEAIARIEKALRSKHSGITALYIKPQTPESWRERIQTAMGDPNAMR